MTSNANKKQNSDPNPIEHYNYIQEGKNKYFKYII
jgi:hypothetical protein